MTIVVMKFGGPAVKTTERIQHVARKIIEVKKQGYQVVVVVSSMPAVRQTIRQSIQDVTDDPKRREKDAVVATGAQMTSALLALALHEYETSAVSLAAWQAGIQTDDTYANARIEQIDSTRINEHLQQGEVVIISGCQGVDKHGNITSLGKGGSEAVAIALAATLQAQDVTIYSEVDGIYTANPLIVEKARKLYEISYDEMLELANLGAHIIHPRAVELAKKYQIPVIVRSFAEEAEGTLMKEEVQVEKNLIVRGVAYEADIVRLTIGYKSYEEASLAEIFSVLADARINVDIIVQAVIDSVSPTISFTIAKEEFANALRVLESSKLSLGFSFADFEVGLAKVSIIGSGMVTNPGVAARMFDRLRAEHIPVKMVSTSEIKVSVVVPQDEMVNAANALHEEFNLAEQTTTY